MKKLLLLTISCASLAACGVKPGSVEPPSGEKASAYPRTYPDVSTDPQSARAPKY